MVKLTKKQAWLSEHIDFTIEQNLIFECRLRWSSRPRAVAILTGGWITKKVALGIARNFDSGWGVFRKDNKLILVKDQAIYKFRIFETIGPHEIGN